MFLWTMIIFFSMLLLNSVTVWITFVVLIVLGLFQSDPMAVLYIKGTDGSLRELGRTEVILNSLSPKWIKKFTVTYQFEMVQNLV